MSDYKKPLPKGTWLRVVGLAPGTTDEQCSAFLRSRGLNVPPEAVNVKNHGDYASAFVVLTNEMLCELVQAKVGNLRVAVVGPKAA